MLPFLKKRPLEAGGAILIKKRDPDEPDSSERQSEDSDIEICAQDMLDAIKANDYKALASAIHAAFQIMELAPHEEGPHTPESEQE